MNLLRFLQLLLVHTPEKVQNLFNTSRWSVNRVDRLRKSKFQCRYSNSFLWQLKILWMVFEDDTKIMISKLSSQHCTGDGQVAKKKQQKHNQLDRIFSNTPSSSTSQLLLSMKRKIIPSQHKQTLYTEWRRAERMQSRSVG